MTLPGVYLCDATAKSQVPKMGVARGEAVALSLGCCASRFGATLFGFNPGGTTMEWTTPQHEVIDLNCEVSSYANAEL
jgi:hypothetical protein